MGYIDFIPKILFIAEGCLITLKYSLSSVFFGLLIGTILAFFKLSKYRSLNLFARFYTSIFRGTPLLIQLFISYYGISQLTGLKIDIFLAGIIAFSLNSGAYVSEIIRSGIEAVDHGQYESAKSLGLKERDIMIDIILPQAVRNVLPALINEIINLLKESAIISLIGEEDIMRRAQVVAAESYDFFPPMITAALCYFILVMIFSALAKFVEKKLAL